MENENIQNTPVENTEVEKEVLPPTPVVEDVKNENIKPKSKLLIPIVIVLALLFVGIGTYIVYTQFFSKPVEVEDVVDQEETDIQDDTITDDTGVCNIGEDDCEDEVTEDVSTDFVGEVLSATLPTGWNIVEYFDGNGTESLPDMTEYVGLTALDILNPENKQVFTLQAISGVGFTGCPEYALFSDNGENYLFEQQSASEEMGEEFNTTDYTNTEYIEFEFLNTTFRRIGKEYFYDTQEGNNYFEPPCVSGLLTLEGLYFEDIDGYKYEAYVYGATEDSTEEDLLVVDTILSTVKVL
jgi:hypothetical protein